VRARLIAVVAGVGLAALLAVSEPAAAHSTTTPAASQSAARQTAAAQPVNWFSATGMVIGLSKVSADNVWAYGEFDPNKSDSKFATVAHWNGQKWSVVNSPLLTQANIEDALVTTSLAAVSATDVWAANSNGILHWNGKAWRVSYKTPRNSAGIDLVAAGSAKNVWAAGYSYTDSGNAVLNFYHWTGAAWYVVPTPFPATNSNDAESVAAMAVTGAAAWAFGYEQAYVGPSTEYPLLLHWNGAQWQVDRYPVRNDTNQVPNAVAVGPHGTLWVVGVGMKESLYWNGKQWRSAAVPGDKSFSLVDAAFIPGGSAWAIGEGDAPMIAHWADNKWQAVRLPASLSPYASLSSVAALSAANAWAAGASNLCYDPRDCRTVILHWNGKAWS
jgi:hypothetical protein